MDLGRRNVALYLHCLSALREMLQEDHDLKLGTKFYKQQQFILQHICHMVLSPSKLGQCVQCLLYKHQELSLDRHSSLKVGHRGIHSYSHNCGTWGPHQDEPCGFAVSQSDLISLPQVLWEIKKLRRRVFDEDIIIDLWPPHTCIHTYIYKHKQPHTHTHENQLFKL